MMYIQKAEVGQGFKRSDGQSWENSVDFPVRERERERERGKKENSFPFRQALILEPNRNFLPPFPRTVRTETSSWRS